MTERSTHAICFEVMVHRPSSFYSGCARTNAPSNLAATAVSSAQVNLTWSDNSTDEIGFTFMFDTNSAFTNPTYVWTGGAGTTSYSHAGRSTATTYYYKIKAEGNPDSAWSNVASATTAPSGLSAAATSNSAVTLNWTGNGSNATIIGYTYAYANNSSFTGATYVYVIGAGSTSTSRTGLSTATTYWWKIKAEGVTDAYDSPFTPAVAATTMPASLSATTASSTQINLSWSGNASNSNIVGYTYTVATNSSFTGAAYRYVNGAATTSASDTSVVSGTTYYYKIKAEGTSDLYDSPFTSYVTATTTSTPNAPSGLSATTASSSQINLNWTDNSIDETGFELKRATDSGFTQNVVWIGGIQGTSYSNTGLSASTTYYYKVRAQGTTQNSAYSNVISATTSAPGTPPNAPSNLAASAVSSTQANLTWSDNSSDETGFELARAIDSGFTQNVVSIPGIQGASYSNTGLNPSTTYYYKVRAQGTGGNSAYSSTVSVTTPSAPAGGVPISPRFFGQNAWMPHAVGDSTKCSLPNCVPLSTDPNDAVWRDVYNSGVVSMRYGGHAVDNDADPQLQETLDQYLAMVDAMRAKGIEPIIQVPFDADHYIAKQAADLVGYVNITNGRGVKYWVIANEPDLHNSDYGTNGYNSGQIANYIRDFASAMKAKDSSIKIIAPETAWYDDTIINALTTCHGADDVTGTDGAGRYYVDILSFHTYPWQTAPARGTVIPYLDNTFKSNLIALKNRVDGGNTCYGRTGANALRMALTEANINWQDANDGLTGTGAKSFLAGQFWAEMLGISMLQGLEFVNFWSTIENSLGYIASDGTTKRPTYWHFQMMAKNFRGSAVNASEVTSITNVKEFAAVDVDQFAVMLMNQDTATSYDYTIRFDTDPVSGTRALKINVAAGRAVEYNSTVSLAPESTLVLIFDTSGVLKKKIEYKRTVNPPPVETTY
jgi:hypothetical protein